MPETVTVSAKIDMELRRKLDKLGIKPSEAIRRALEREVEERTREELRKEVGQVSRILSKVPKEIWVKTVREGRDER